MLCFGKKNKKKGSGKQAKVTRDDYEFMKEEGCNRDKLISGERCDVALKANVAEEIEERKGNVEQKGGTCSNDQVKSILHHPDKNSQFNINEQGTRKRSRTVSFSLSEDLTNPEQLGVLEETEDKTNLEQLETTHGGTGGAEEATLRDRRRDRISKIHQHKPVMSNQVPAIAKPAPFFKGTAVVDGEFKDIALDDYKGRYVVLFFYPLDFTFVCPTEIIAFSERAEEFSKIGCDLVACSTDSHFSHLAWVNTPRKDGGLGAMNIPLLADKSMEISKAYGVLKEDEGLAFRGLFIIDGNQNLRQATINDLPVGRDVDETLRLVQAFQYVEKHGEVCPAGWKPGSKTMKADPTGSKEYFQSEN